MRATVMYKARYVRIENIPDTVIVEPTDAVIRVTRACICGSDLWPDNGGPNVEGQRMGHEAIGVVDDVGSDVQTIRRGQVVIMPLASSDGTCMFCDEGLPTRAFIAASSVMVPDWTALKPRPCAFLAPTGPCSPWRSRKTTR